MVRKDISKIRYTLNKRQYLELVTTSVNRIPERIRHIEDGYFIVYNKITGKYEVHSTFNYGDTFCFIVPYPELDDRTLTYCLETNIANRGDDIVKDIDERNRKADKARKRQRSSMNHDIAQDMQKRTAYGVERDTMHSDYKSTHVMG